MNTEVNLMSDFLAGKNTRFKGLLKYQNRCRKFIDNIYTFYTPFSLLMISNARR